MILTLMPLAVSNNSSSEGLKDDWTSTMLQIQYQHCYK